MHASVQAQHPQLYDVSFQTNSGNYPHKQYTGTNCVVSLYNNFGLLSKNSEDVETKGVEKSHFGITPLSVDACSRENRRNISAKFLYHQNPQSMANIIVAHSMRVYLFVFT